jgi:hypothetical protein
VRIPIHLVILLTAILGGTGCGTNKPRFKEPSYQGKPLTAWLRDYEMFQFANDTSGEWSPPWTAEDRKVREHAVQAVRQLGTNAIPVLLEMMTDNNGDYGRLAISGFRALGAAGRPAVPTLVKSLEQTLANFQSRNYSNYDIHPAGACMALGAIGPAAEDGVPILLEWRDRDKGPPAVFALQALGEIHMHPEQAVPALISDLSNCDTNYSSGAHLLLTVLGNYGDQAKAAVPSILPFLSSKDDTVRATATNTLKQIGFNYTKAEEK